MKKLTPLITLALMALMADEKPRPLDFTQPVLDLDGKPIQNDAGGKLPGVLTLSDVVVTALESQLDEDRGVSGAVKFERDELARKCYKKTSVVLTAEEIATIKDRIGKSFGPMVVGAAWRMLDPAAQKPSEKKEGEK